MGEQIITRRGAFSVAAAGLGLAVDSKARAQFASRTFVLIPGAFCGGWVWRRVSDLLESKGHKVFSPTLTGLASVRIC